jgi:6-phosphogluconate dehydrogenase
MKIGFIGLGKMGSRMVSKLSEDGHEIIVWNRSKEPIEALQSKIPHLKATETVEEMVKELAGPRIIWLMLPAGEVTQTMLTQLVNLVEPNDIVINGANEHFSVTEKNYREYNEKDIRFLGIGVSGGIIAEKEGYPLMIGGDKSAYEYSKPLLESLAKPKGGYAYVGEGGAGHFVKMVHNAIEYGYMQAIGEGFGVLEKSPYNFDLAEIAQVYRKNTLISGFMMDRTEESLLHDQKLSELEGVIAESGEAKWTIDEAKKHHLPITVIEHSLQFRKQSQTDANIASSFAARMVAALRNAFGGHAVKKK